MTLVPQAALDGPRLGAGDRLWLQPWAEGEQEHCEVSLGVMEDTGPQEPTPTRPALPVPPAQPFRPSQLSQPHQLLAAACAPVSCSCLGRLSQKGSFRQSSRQDLPDEVCKAAPERAHRPCGEPVEDSSPSTSMSASSLPPPPDRPLPAASTLSPTPMTHSVSVCSLSSLSALQPPEHFLPLHCLSYRPRARTSSTSCLPDSDPDPPPSTPTSDSQSTDRLPIDRLPSELSSM